MRIDPSRPTERRRPDVIAHRGFGGDNTENTLRAVRTAVAVADAVEVDVRRCGSGELVVVHDRRLHRLAGRPHVVGDLTLAELQKIEIGPDGDRIPTLRDVVAAIPDGVELVLELKERDIAADAVRIAEAAGIDAWFSTAEPATLVELRGIPDARRTAWIVRASILNRAMRVLLHQTLPPLYRLEDPQGIVDRAAHLGCRAIHPRYELCLYTDLVERAHDAGLGVAVWTVEDRETIERLASVGVTAVSVDRAALVDRHT